MIRAGYGGGAETHLVGEPAGNSLLPVVGVKKKVGTHSGGSVSVVLIVEQGIAVP